MLKSGGDSRKYTEYCKEHEAEFSYQLKDEANTALVSWPARAVIVLMIIASVYTFIDQQSKANPFAPYTLIAYFVPILLVASYPLGTLLHSSLTKLSTLVIDLLCITGMLGFCLAVYLVFIGAEVEEDRQNNIQLLQGQIAFVIALGTAFAYHTRYSYTLLRNFAFTLTVSVAIYFINDEFFRLNLLPIVEGFFMGAVISWVFHDGNQTRFYLKSTDANTRQHLYNQLSKLVYPHQLERIKLGDELEDTMPLKEGKAIINVFDVQRSSEIKHENLATFFTNLFQVFLEICMRGYDHNPLRSQAFRLKETGDGFISSVGYPFLPVDSRSLADSAVATALDMFEAFNQEVEKFNYSRPIKASMGLAYNSVQGTFQSGGIRAYDLFGEALIQATRYEDLRKDPVIWDIICEKAEERGLEHFNVLVVQEVIYNSLSPAYRDVFTEIDLADERLATRDFGMVYDRDANYIYFHILA